MWVNFQSLAASRAPRSATVSSQGSLLASLARSYRHPNVHGKTYCACRSYPKASERCVTPVHPKNG